MATQYNLMVILSTLLFCTYSKTHHHTLSTPFYTCLPSPPLGTAKIIPTTFLSYSPSYSHSFTAFFHTLHTPLFHILPIVIRSTLISSPVHSAHCQKPSTLLSYTYCPLSYPPYFSPVHSAHCQTLHTPLLYIL
ncbi:unnamed protein product, partial [Staurois parvus]